MANPFGFDEEERVADEPPSGRAVTSHLTCASAEFKVNADVSGGDGLRRSDTHEYCRSPAEPNRRCAGACIRSGTYSQPHRFVDASLIYR